MGQTHESSLFLRGRGEESGPHEHRLAHFDRRTHRTPDVA
jgi:hypothetical protein